MAAVNSNGSRQGDDGNGDGDGDGNCTTISMSGSQGNSGKFYLALCPHAPPGARVRGNRVRG
jgi:hypothetical protein